MTEFTVPISDDSEAKRSFVAIWLSHPKANYYLVLIPTLLLIGLGLIEVLSASSVDAFKRYGGDSFYYVKRQALFVLIGLIGMAIMAKANAKWIRLWGLIFLIAAFTLQLLTYTPLGWEKGGNTNWLDFGAGIPRIQPSELAKLALVLWAASIFDNKQKFLHLPRHVVVPFVPTALVLILLIAGRSDLGTAVVIFAIMLAVLWFVGARWQILASILAGAAALAVTLIVASPNRMGRILGFLDQGSDTLGANHQPIKAEFAMASGGWWGSGLGASKQKWGGLVEAHTDYVLAIIGEELGLVCILVVLMLFTVLGLAGFRIAMKNTQPLFRYAAAGVTSFLMIQTLINVLVVMRLLPVIGIPLPFLSYGGSALLADLFGIGILLACAKQAIAVEVESEPKTTLGPTVFLQETQFAR